MSNKIEYKCASCGEIHEQWPALAFMAPTAYHCLPEDVKQEMGELSADFCVIHHPEQTDRFIRGTLTIKVVDHCECLEYGIWVSLSEKSFLDYQANFGNPQHDAKYFGWLSNDIPEYEIASIPTTVFSRLNNLRPEIVPHEDFRHPLVDDYYQGITKAEAESRIHQMLKVTGAGSKKAAPTKRWWKLW